MWFVTRFNIKQRQLIERNGICVENSFTTKLSKGTDPLEYCQDKKDKLPPTLIAEILNNISDVNGTHQSDRLYIENQFYFNNALNIIPKNVADRYPIALGDITNIVCSVESSNKPTVKKNVKVKTVLPFRSSTSFDVSFYKESIFTVKIVFYSPHSFKTAVSFDADEKTVMEYLNRGNERDKYAPSFSFEK